jgi:trehalose-6-phosphate synthase
MVTICHVSIDTAKLTQHMTDATVQSKAAELQAKYAGKRIMGSVDPCHRLSGLASKFLAFERLLNDYPVYQKTVSAAICIATKA